MGRLLEAVGHRARSVLTRYGAAAIRRKAAHAALISAVAVFPLAAPAETVIAALGDSLTQGYGLAPADGLVAQLERWLQREGVDVRIINAGVSGDTTAGGLSRVAWTLADAPDAMMVALGGNDLLRGLAPEETRANLTGILDAARDAEVPVFLVGIRAPGNFGADYQTAFDAIFPDLANRPGVQRGPDIFAAFEGMEIDQRRAILQPDGLHPNAQGVALMVETLGPALRNFIRAELAPDHAG